jgi:hypothetical protein
MMKFEASDLIDCVENRSDFYRFFLNLLRIYSFVNQLCIFFCVSRLNHLIFCVPSVIWRFAIVYSCLYRKFLKVKD